MRKKSFLMTIEFPITKGIDNLLTKKYGDQIDLLI